MHVYSLVSLDCSCNRARTFWRFHCLYQADIAILQDFYKWLTEKGHTWGDMKIIEDNLRDAGLGFCYLQDAFIKYSVRDKGKNDASYYVCFVKQS